GDQVEQRGLAGAVRANDQPPLAGLDAEIDVGGDAQAPERLAQPADGQRGHGLGSALGASTTPRRRRNARRPSRHSRTVPGTSPSGIRMTIATKMGRSRKFRRWM